MINSNIKNSIPQFEENISLKRKAWSKEVYANATEEERKLYDEIRQQIHRSCRGSSN